MFKLVAGCILLYGKSAASLANGLLATTTNEMEINIRAQWRYCLRIKLAPLQAKSLFLSKFAMGVKSLQSNGRAQMATTFPLMNYLHPTSFV